MPRLSWLRTVYLYLFSVIGLVLLIVGSISFVDMALKAFVFTKADAPQRVRSLQPPVLFELSRVEKIAQDDASDLTEQQRQAIERWLADYRAWEERSEEIDHVIADRQRTASRNLAMILVGLPLYLYHWRVIRREQGKSYS